MKTIYIVYRIDDGEFILYGAYENYEKAKSYAYELRALIQATYYYYSLTK